MKDLPPRPQPPQPLVTLPHELRLVQVDDAELREAPDGERRHVVRPRSVRRRLFFDDESTGEDWGAAGSSEAGRRRRRVRRVEDALAVYVLQPAQDTVDKMAAEETAAASRRWNFDFENERPLEGQWQWEKVGDLAASAADGNGDPQLTQPFDECHSPQR